MTFRRRSAFSLTLGTVAGLVLLLISVPNIGPVLRAARGDGTPGVFTAERRSCVSHFGHEACSWEGIFRSQEGDAARVSLYGDANLRPGEQVTAVDPGRRGRVYPPGGSREWILTGALLLLGLTMLVPVRPGRRRAVPAAAA